MNGHSSALLLLLLQVSAGAFELASPEGAAAIFVPPDEPESVRLAARDLVEDVNRITGREPQLVSGWADCSPHAVVLATVAIPASAQRLEALAPGLTDELRGKWEAYRVRTVDVRAPPVREALIIAGSDERGTMFGLYAFCERHLGVDPLHFWKDWPPPKRERLAWDSVELSADEPTFRYRGWFLNDEDLLTEWHEGGGERDIAYPYYHQVTAPTATRHVFEAALRLQMNLIIPASFVDIRNPAEERLVADAARRGLFVSQHHIEPLGVSGFGFANYWRDRGEQVPFSFVRHRAKFAAIWRDYAERWARYAPRVIWQLGLRGVADRPVWVSDPAVPKSAADRGRLISKAIAMQAATVREVAPRENPPMTATLWMEGSELHRQGHLTFPPGVCVVFADNSPGWSLPRDFHEAEREPGRCYGLYYHHQLWGSGPHLVRAVSPQRTHGIFTQVVKTGATHYAILNVGNLREFVLGLDATARMLRDFDSFDPDRFLTSWCPRHFSPEAERAEQCCRQFFDSFVDEQGRRRLLDGETLHTGRRFLSAILRRLRAKEERIVHRPDVVRRRLAAVREQRTALEAAGKAPPDVRDRLTGPQQRFFEANFMAQQGILLGLLRWLEADLQAGLELNDGEREPALSRLEEAQSACADIRRAQALASQGERWRHWYCGDRKMNLARARKLTAEVLAFVDKMAEGD